MLCWNIPLVYFVFLNILWKYLFIYHDVKIDSELMEKKKHFKTMYSTFPPCQNTETECYICLENNEESPVLQYLPCFLCWSIMLTIMYYLRQQELNKQEQVSNDCKNLNEDLAIYEKAKSKKTNRKCYKGTKGNSKCDIGDLTNDNKKINS